MLSRGHRVFKESAKSRLQRQMNYRGSKSEDFASTPQKLQQLFKAIVFRQFVGEHFTAKRKIFHISKTIL